MPNLVNRLLVRDLEREFATAEGLVVAAFGGLTVKETEGLRGQLAEKGVRFRMVRNSLARHVLATRGLAFPEDAIAGNTAIAWGDAEAAIHAAKVLTSPEVKKVGKVRLRASVLDGRVLGPADTQALAGMPDQATLRAQILGCLSGPARGLVTLLDALPSSLARVLQARADQLGGEAADGGAAG